jgi:glycosyltransferase involved in cell wall biosynthesis
METVFRVRSNHGLPSQSRRALVWLLTMKLLYYHNNGDLYGSSRSLLRLCARLVNDGNAVSAVLPYEGPLSDALRQAGVMVWIQRGMAVVERSVFQSPWRAILFLLRFPISVARFIARIRKDHPDLVHSNTSVMLSSAVAARLTGVRHIWHIREFYSEFPGFWSLYQRLMALFSDRIICVSRAVQEQFSGSAKTKTVVLHNGFPADEFKAVSSKRIAAFRKAHRLTAPKLVGVVGRLKLKRKGQEIFVAAAQQIAMKHPDVQFVLIGSVFPGNEEHEVQLRRLAEPLGDRAVFTGEVEDIKAAYSSLDIVVMPSGMPEPFGGVVIEAMAMGKPVIATGIGGTPEQVVDGETGLLVKPNDSDALAAAMNRILSDKSLAAAMGRAGKQRYLERFEFEEFYHSMKMLYRGSYEYTLPD